MRSAGLRIALVLAGLGYVVASVLAEAPAAPHVAAASTPTPTLGPATSTPFPFHFTTLPQHVTVGRPLVLAVEAQPLSGAPVSYQWDLGDGTRASGASIDHAYVDAGTYTIVVTATSGGVATIQTAVSADPPLPPAVLVLAPGEQGQMGFTHSCPPAFFFPATNEYITGSCGPPPVLVSIVNDGEVPLSFTRDSVTGMLTLAVPQGWAVVAPDIAVCTPVNPDATNVVTCNGPSFVGLFGFSFHLRAVPAGTYPASVRYPAGWNLVANGYLAAREGTVDTLEGGSYQPLQPVSFDSGTVGYWAYFPHAVAVLLPPRGPLGGTVMPRAAAWKLIGNPGQVPVAVEGADVVETYDPSTGTYESVNVLRPGEGAWAYSTNGGYITLVAELLLTP